MEATFDSRPGALSPSERRRSRLGRAGLSPRRQRQLDLVLSALVVLFVVGWAYAISDSIEHGEAGGLAARVTTNPLSRTAPPEAAFVLDALVRRLASVELEEWRGASGAVRVVLQAPGESVPALADSLSGGADVVYVPARADSAAAAAADSAAVGAPVGPGIWNVALRMGQAVREVPDLNIISLIPLSSVRGGRLGEYRIGEWPEGVGGAHAAAYAPPSGLVEVTPENQDMLVSEHFVLGDFLTKGQADVWPKYVVINARLLDKLELTLQELEAMGHPVENVFVISGFRTPNYNAHGGDTQGRGALSRHMYGDAADIAIDNDRDGRMDDLNGDGKVDVKDARIVAEAAERVEKKYPNLIGGIGIYKPTGAHSGFVHIDVRGWRARW